MPSNPQIIFQGLEISAATRDEIFKQIIRLQDSLGCISMCRVTVKAASAHRRHGGHYRLRLLLNLPNHREVDIDRTIILSDHHPSDQRDALSSAALSAASEHAPVAASYGGGLQTAMRRYATLRPARAVAAIALTALVAAVVLHALHLEPDAAQPARNQTDDSSTAAQPMHDAENVTQPPPQSAAATERNDALTAGRAPGTPALTQTTLRDLRVAVKGTDTEIRAADFTGLGDDVKERLLGPAQTLAASGEAEAQFFLGMLLVETHGHVDMEKAFTAFGKAAEHGYVDAQANLGIMLQKGVLKTGRDLRAARRWFKIAADNGGAKAQFWLGCYYQYGWGGSVKSAGRAAGEFDRAIAGGYAPAREAREALNARLASPCLR